MTGAQDSGSIAPLIDQPPAVAAPDSSDLHARAEAVAGELRATLEPIVRAVAGSGMRPAALARGLAIDRTLAARVVRAVRATDAVATLGEIPAPGGLRIFLEAAGRAGVPPQALERSGACLSSFEHLINEFPGGRTALNAALARYDAGVRRRTEGGAKQVIHRAMASLVGYQADAMLATVFVRPSEDPRYVDELYVLGKYGVRRMRDSAPITVFGRRADSHDPSLPRERVETIRGERSPEHAAAYLIQDHCSKPIPPISLFHTDGLYLYTLADTVPAVNVPVTLVSAQIVRNSSTRYCTDEQRHHWIGHTSRFPCKVLLADVFIHEDLWPGEPTLTTNLHSLASGMRRPDAPAFQLDKIDLSTKVIPLGRGGAEADCPDIPRYRELLNEVTGRAGWDISSFAGYRCRVQYPVPLVTLTFWFDLPHASEDWQI